MKRAGDPNIGAALVRLASAAVALHQYEAAATPRPTPIDLPAANGVAAASRVQPGTGAAHTEVRG